MSFFINKINKSIILIGDFMLKRIYLLIFLFCLCGCTKYYRGEYSYENPDNKEETIGVKLKIKIEDDLIKKIEIDEDTNFYYNAYGVWNEKQNWLIYSYDYINSFLDKNINDILNIKIDINEKGQPYNIDYDFISGATYSSGQFILALQDAIKNYQN